MQYNKNSYFFLEKYLADLLGYLEMRGVLVTLHQTTEKFIHIVLINAFGCLVVFWFFIGKSKAVRACLFFIVGIEAIEEIVAMEDVDLIPNMGKIVPNMGIFIRNIQVALCCKNDKHE